MARTSAYPNVCDIFQDIYAKKSEPVLQFYF
jgi:hypothetical protein